MPRALIASTSGALPKGLRSPADRPEPLRLCPLPFAAPEPKPNPFLLLGCSDSSLAAAAGGRNESNEYIFTMEGLASLLFYKVTVFFSRQIA